MGIYDDASVFASIVKNGGFSHAAKVLGFSNGLVSRRVAQLEEELGVKLLRRTTRHFDLTPEGQIFYLHAERILQELNSAKSALKSVAEKPSGLIRIGAPAHVIRCYLSPLINRLLPDFPKVSIDLVTSDNLNYLQQNKIDILVLGVSAIKAPPPFNDDLQAAFLVELDYFLCATSNYLHHFGEPAHPDDLAVHQGIYFNESNQAVSKEVSRPMAWQYLEGSSVFQADCIAKLVSTDIDTCIDACLSNLGIGRFAMPYVETHLQSKKLVNVLSEYSWGKVSLYAMHLKKGVTKNTLLILDYLTSRFGSEAH